MMGVTKPATLKSVEIGTGFKAQATMLALRHLQSGGCLHLTGDRLKEKADQRSVQRTFHGITRQYPQGMANLALLGGAAILPYFCTLQPGGRVRIDSTLPCGLPSRQPPRALPSGSRKLKTSSAGLPPCWKPRSNRLPGTSAGGEPAPRAVIVDVPRSPRRIESRCWLCHRFGLESPNPGQHLPHGRNRLGRLVSGILPAGEAVGDLSLRTRVGHHLEGQRGVAEEINCLEDRPRGSSSPGDPRGICSRRSASPCFPAANLPALVCWKNPPRQRERTAVPGVAPPQGGERLYSGWGNDVLSSP